MNVSCWRTVSLALFLGCMPGLAEAIELFVSPAAGGNRGTASRPFGRIQDALDVARPGDVVNVAPGTYPETLRTVRSGTAAAPILVRSVVPRGAVVTAPGRVLTVGHEHLHIEGLVLDGQFGRDDVVRISADGSFFLLRDAEVRRTSRDLIDMDSPRGVRIETTLIHHALNAAGGRTDAHGVVAGAVRNLTIRDTEIHTFSGDGLQLDPGRAAPGWDGVTLERVLIWLAPLPEAVNGFPAASVPGENGVDTKASSSLPRSRLSLTDVTLRGFRGGFIRNMAALNLKENVSVSIDRATVSESEIAFRLRGGPGGGARVSISNAVIHDVTTAFRYEDSIRELRLSHCTVGANVDRVFQAAASDDAGLTVRNLLVLGALPAEADHPSNLAVDVTAFRQVAAHDYHLSNRSPAIDTGATGGVTLDREGTPRPQGAGPDVGAYEQPVAPVGPSPRR